MKVKINNLKYYMLIILILFAVLTENAHSGTLADQKDKLISIHEKYKKFTVVNDNLIDSIIGGCSHCYFVALHIGCLETTKVCTGLPCKTPCIGCANSVLSGVHCVDGAALGRRYCSVSGGGPCGQCTAGICIVNSLLQCLNPFGIGLQCFGGPLWAGPVIGLQASVSGDRC